MRKTKQESSTPPHLAVSPPLVPQRVKSGGSAEPLCLILFCFLLFNPLWSLPFIWIFPQKPGYVASVYSHGSLCHRWCNTAKYSTSGCVLVFLSLPSPLSVYGTLLISFYLLYFEIISNLQKSFKNFYTSYVCFQNNFDSRLHTTCPNPHPSISMVQVSNPQNLFLHNHNTGIKFRNFNIDTVRLHNMGLSRPIGQIWTANWFCK